MIKAVNYKQKNHAVRRGFAFNYELRLTIVFNFSNKGT